MFKADLCLADTSGEMTAKLTMHLPVIAPKHMAFTPYALVFRPRAGKLAVLCMGKSKQIALENLLDNGVPVGDVVSDTLFPGAM